MPVTDTNGPITGINNEIEDIISVKPPLLVRYGTSIFFVLLIIGGAACWFIKAADRVQGKAIIRKAAGKNEFIAETSVPQSAFYKIKKGLEVVLKFYAYPPEQYGNITGIIDSVDRTTYPDGFHVLVRLYQPAVENKANSIQLQEGLEAEAGIICHHQRLFRKIFSNINW